MSAPSAIELVTTFGALIGAISSTKPVCATKMRPSWVVITASARVPPLATLTISRVFRLIIHKLALCAIVAPLATTLPVWLLAINRPASSLPV